MIPLPYKILAIVGTAFVLFCMGAATGYEVANRKYLNFKAETEKVASVAQAKVEQDRKYDQEITNSVVERYKSELARVQQHSSSGGVFSIPKASSGTDDSGSYAALVIECKKTTIQLNYLQEWVNDQYKEDLK
jgi:hypothetical protein